MRAFMSCFALALGLLSAAPASADIIPPDVARCRGKEAGDACSMSGPDGKGVCVKSTCSRWSYDPAAGKRAPVKRECLKCRPGKPAPKPRPKPKPTPKPAPTPAADMGASDQGVAPAADMGAAPTADQGASAAADQGAPAKADKAEPGAPKTTSASATTPSTDAVPRQRGGCATPGGEGVPVGLIACAGLGLLAVCRRREDV